jgi:hypothetical protein
MTNIGDMLREFPADRPDGESVEVHAFGLDGQRVSIDDHPWEPGSYTVYVDGRQYGEFTLEHVEQHPENFVLERAAHELFRAELEAQGERRQ